MMFLQIVSSLVMLNKIALLCENRKRQFGICSQGLTCKGSELDSFVSIYLAILLMVILLFDTSFLFFKILNCHL